MFFAAAEQPVVLVRTTAASLLEPGKRASFALLSRELSPARLPCAMGEDAAWMCVDPAEWRASLRRSENASQAEA